jgi:putative IMPACT (imprinted ancient) family translation regulator
VDVLTHSGLGNTIAVVTRYFGGIKLGAGGLVRAYSQSVSEALKQLETTEQRVISPLSIQFPYTYQGKLDHYLTSQGISITSQSFEADVSYILAVPVSKLELTIIDIANQTQGQVKIAR